jgi:hypothetical protein
MRGRGVRDHHDHRGSGDIAAAQEDNYDASSVSDDPASGNQSVIVVP